MTPPILTRGEPTVRQAAATPSTLPASPDEHRLPYRARALLIGFALASIAVLLSGVLAYRAASEFAESSRLVRRAYEVLDSIQAIEVRYSRTASAARAYILSGNPIFLQFYRQEVATIEPAIDQALQRMSEEPAQREELAALIRQMNDRIRMIEDGLRAYEAGGLAAVTGRTLPASDRTLEQRVLEIIETAKRDHEAILALRIATDASRLSGLRRTLVVFLAATVAVLALLLLRTRALESKRDRIERDYERQRRLLETIVESAPMGIYFKDAGGSRLHLVNRPVEEMAGQPRETLVGTGSGEPYPGALSDAALAAEREMVERRLMLTEQQVEVNLASGRRTLRVRRVLVPGADGRLQYLLGILEDVTERLAAEAALKQMAQRLEQKSRELEAANKELESFGYSVSHDLRAPLRAVDGFAAILAEDYDARLDDEGRRLLGNIRSSAKHMAQLIQDLLALSGISRQPMVQAAIDTTELVHAAWEAQLSANPELRAELQIRGSLPPSWGDPRLLQQVWTNLLENAIKYSSRAPQPRVVVEGVVESGDTVFHVEDNGVGFDMRYYERLFEVFQRLHGESEFPGTGVGLAIVQRIVVRHGGRVWAQSEPGKGARFSFAIPGEPQRARTANHRA
jgi:PAS domain S-box-containing protein